MKQKNRILVILTGIIIGAAAILLVKNGNPGNMGMCIACFIRDTAGNMHPSDEYLSWKNSSSN